MTGLIFHIRSFAIHDGPGIRQTIFLKGCPLRCPWCHNPESQNEAAQTMTNSKRIGEKVYQVSEKVGTVMDVNQVMNHILQDVMFFEESGGGVTLSGGEPLMQPDFTLALLKKCKQHHVHTAIDTCGYARPEIIEMILPFTDLFLYDLKLADDSAHQNYTGVSNQPILRNLEIIASHDKPVFIRIPLIPEITDTSENLEALQKIIENVPVIKRIDLLPYHGAAQSKYEHLGISNSFRNKTTYSREKALGIKELFSQSVEVVSIGG